MPLPRRPAAPAAAPRVVRAPAPAVPPAPQPPSVTPAAETDDVLALTRGGLVEKLSPAVQAALAAGAKVVAGHLVAAVVPDVTTTPRTIEAQAPGAVSSDNWFFVRRLDEYPGNFPPLALLQQIGITGVMIGADDPLRAQGAATARQYGFKVGVWEDASHFSHVEEYIAAMQQAQQDTGADAIGLDVEAGAKGKPGSVAFELSQAIASQAAATFTVPWAVVPVRSDRNDFDFRAYTDAGGSVIVQTYGEDPQQNLYDPVEVVQLALAAGVPPDKISVLLSAPQLATALPALRAFGITRISVFTSDGLTPEVVSAASPFLTSPPETDPEYAPSDVETPAGVDSEDAAYTLADESAPTSPDDPPDEIGDTAASLGPLVLDYGGRSLAGVRQVTAPQPHGPTPPEAVTSEIRDDVQLLKVPKNVAIGIRTALFVVQRGIPYVWGGTDPNRGLDCSGFAQYVLRAAGVKTIRRDTYSQAKQGHTVDAAHRQPLDLLFFEPTSRGPGHVAIYMARGWAVHEPHHDEDAQWLNLANWRPLFTRRYLADISSYQAEAAKAKALTETAAAYQHVAPDNAWHMLRHRLAVTWPALGAAAKSRGDVVLRAIDSGK